MPRTMMSDNTTDITDKIENKSAEIVTEDNKDTADNKSPAKGVDEWATKLSEGWTKNFGMFKQFTMQKIGKASPSPQDPQFKETLTKFQCTRNELRDLRDSTTHMDDSLRDLIASFTQFTSSIAHLGGHQKVTSAASRRAQSFVDIEASLGPQLRQLVNSFEALVLNPVNNSLDNEVSNIMQLIDSFETTHLDRDARSSTLAEMMSRPVNDPKRVAAEEAFRNAEKTLQDSKTELLRQITNLNNFKEDLLFRQLGELLVIVNSFCSFANKNVEDITSQDNGAAQSMEPLLNADGPR